MQFSPRNMLSALFHMSDGQHTIKCVRVVVERSRCVLERISALVVRLNSNIRVYYLG